MADQMFDSRFEPAITPGASKDTAIGMFYTEAAKDDIASKKEGKAVYKDVVMVKIRIPGDKFNEPIHVATDEHKRRFPAAWEAFQKGKQSAVEGTPIERWPILTPAQVMTLKAHDVLSVEILAGYPENRLPNMPEIYRLKQQAADWLKSASGNADATRLQEDLRTANERAEKLQTRIHSLEAAVAALREQPEKVKRKYTKRAANDLPD